MNKKPKTPGYEHQRDAHSVGEFANGDFVLKGFSEGSKVWFLVTRPARKNGVVLPKCIALASGPNGLKIADKQEVNQRWIKARRPAADGPPPEVAQAYEMILARGHPALSG